MRVYVSKESGLDQAAPGIKSIVKALGGTCVSDLVGDGGAEAEVAVAFSAKSAAAVLDATYRTVVVVCVPNETTAPGLRDFVAHHDRARMASTADEEGEGVESIVVVLDRLFQGEAPH